MKPDFGLVLLHSLGDEPKSDSVFLLWILVFDYGLNFFVCQGCRSTTVHVLACSTIILLRNHVYVVSILLFPHHTLDVKLVTFVKHDAIPGWKIFILNFD